MAKKRAGLINPGTGESIRCITTAEETGGKYVTMELIVGPHGCDRKKNINFLQEQTIQVKEGIMRLCRGSGSRLFLAGDPVRIKRGSASCWCNGSDAQMLTVEITLSPTFRRNRIFKKQFAQHLHTREAISRVFVKATMFKLNTVLLPLVRSILRSLDNTFVKFIHRLPRKTSHPLTKKHNV